MWNLYAGNHPDLHDNYMDPPGQIMIHSDSGRSVSPCSPSKSKEAFNVFYGAQSMSANPLTTSAMVEMQKLCLLSSLAQCDAAKPAPQTVDHNGNVGHANSSCFLKCPQQSTVSGVITPNNMAVDVLSHHQMLPQNAVHVDVLAATSVGSLSFHQSLADMKRHAQLTLSIHTRLNISPKALKHFC
ncbi:hypothetical protein EB796_005264 [Bugula neritina]|uniref:Uncharacterized protein n=1 Tax=Bugula neritina TaxID=10212 RepID=A0A7J7KCN3_BUGNE|nr:hypothetical protein EB796_005264 [Bugula neritina]